MPDMPSPIRGSTGGVSGGDAKHPGPLRSRLGCPSAKPEVTSPAEPPACVPHIRAGFGSSGKLV